LVISGILAFGWANYRIFTKQQAKNASLQKLLASQEVHASDLVIEVDAASRYILHPVDNIA